MTRRHDDVFFDEEDCTCSHPPSAHDDGFGCTDEDCTCLAGWSMSRD